MRRGFLLNSKKEEDGPLRDPRATQYPSFGVSRKQHHNRVGTASASWPDPISSSQTTTSSPAKPSTPTWTVVRPTKIKSEPTKKQGKKDAISSSSSVPSVAQTDDASSLSTPSGITNEPDDNSSFSPLLVQGGGLFKGQTNYFPNKSTYVPRQALSAWFGMKPRCHQLTKDSYVTWNDGALSHNQMFTSVFVDPLSGECFSSGRYGTPEEKKYKVDYVKVPCKNKNNNESVAIVPVVWYKQKTLSEHGAAARAYDCLVFRKSKSRSACIGVDPPYLAQDCPTLPPWPSFVEAKVQELQAMARSRLSATAGGAGGVLPMEQDDNDNELLQQRNEYRQARKQRNFF